METLSLPTRHIIYDAGHPIDYVYFPYTAVVSLLTVLKNGTAVEVGTVGNEGMVGVSLFLGVDTIPGKATVQIPGEAMRMKAPVFVEEIKQGGALPSLLHRYTYAMLVQISQTAACNRLHTLEERLCRWLLMTHDRVQDDEYPLTQEFLGQMLGVSRPRVYLAANLVQKAGLIRYTRGKITILDRPGLEASACECYKAVQEEFNRIYR